MSITWIKHDDLTPHPMNAQIFTTTEQDEQELRSQIQMHNIIVPILVNERPDGTLRIISGHRRVQIAKEFDWIHSVKAEIIKVGDAEELLLLFACNVGRDMKEAYKVRFFKAVKQFLRQFKENIDKQSTSDGNEHEVNPFVDVVDRLGVDVGSMKMWQVIKKITGFSEREQYTLTHICDLEYRNKVLNDLKSAVKIKESVVEYLRNSWQELEDSICNGQTTVLLADKQVKHLLKQIELIKNPPVVQKVKKKPAPIVKEKANEKNASMYVNTAENALKHMQDSWGERVHRGFQVDEVVLEMVKWAQLVLENQ